MRIVFGIENGLKKRKNFLPYLGSNILVGLISYLRHIRRAMLMVQLLERFEGTNLVVDHDFGPLCNYYYESEEN